MGEQPLTASAPKNKPQKPKEGKPLHAVKFSKMSPWLQQYKKKLNPKARSKKPSTKPSRSAQEHNPSEADPDDEDEEPQRGRPRRGNGGNLPNQHPYGQGPGHDEPDQSTVSFIRERPSNHEDLNLDEDDTDYEEPPGGPTSYVRTHPDPSPPGYASRNDTGSGSRNSLSSEASSGGLHRGSEDSESDAEDSEPNRRPVRTQRRRGNRRSFEDED